MQGTSSAAESMFVGDFESYLARNDIPRTYELNSFYFECTIIMISFDFKIGRFYKAKFDQQYITKITQN